MERPGNQKNEKVLAYEKKVVEDKLLLYATHR